MAIKKYQQISQALIIINGQVTVATRSSLYPDQRVTAVTRIQYVSSPDGGSAPRKDLYSPDRQRRPGQLEPQIQIPVKTSSQTTTGNRLFFCTF